MEAVALGGSWGQVLRVMSFVMVDVESDGPIPGDYSMIEFGAVIVESGLGRTFHARMRPISERWVPEALAVSGHTREATLGFDAPEVGMTGFREWLAAELLGKRPLFISDNNGYDWQFINWYFHHFLGANPFGHSSTNLGSLYKGVVRDLTKNFKHLRRTPHTHHPVQDAMGNAEAFLEILEQNQIRVRRV
jgi:hypothetical protein